MLTGNGSYCANGTKRLPDEPERSGMTEKKLPAERYMDLESTEPAKREAAQSLGWSEALRAEPHEHCK